MRTLAHVVFVLGAVLVIVLGIVLRPGRDGGIIQPSLAFSLGEAERRLRTSPQAPAAVISLGGMTRLSAVVYDPVTADLVLVGSTAGDDGSALRLDDFVTAVRALFTHSTHPLVSIDQTADTPRTGRQRVRFEGGIEGTPFGASLLACDVGLKWAALWGLGGLTSYFDLSVAAVRSRGIPARISTKFWYYPRATLAAREGIFTVATVEVGVEARVLGRGDVRDEPAESFARAAAASLVGLGQAQPEVRRLGPLFTMVALADGIRAFRPRPRLDYWLHVYPVARVETPTEYVLVKREQVLAGAGGSRRLTVDGGIGTDPLVMRVEDGDLTAWRDVVLRSRPGPSALTWRLPLDASRSRDLGAGRWAERAPGRLHTPGAHLTREVTVAPAFLERSTRRGGVYGDVDVRPEDFRSR